MLEATSLGEHLSAHAACHMTPGMIAQAMAHWPLPADILIGHMAPGREGAILVPPAGHAPKKAVTVAQPGVTFESQARADPRSAALPPPFAPSARRQGLGRGRGCPG